MPDTQVHRRRASVVHDTSHAGPTAPPTLAAVTGLLNVLRHLKVKFLRVETTDSEGIARAKSIVIGPHATAMRIAQGVNFVECLAALPLSFDVIAPDSGLSASGILLLSPDFDTLRVLPTELGTSTAACFGTLVDPGTGMPSDLCPREKLRSSINAAVARGIRFTVGIEVEFQVVTKQRTTQQNFSTVGKLAENAEFMASLEDLLATQGVELELVHAESAPGQLEVVLRYSDPLTIADHLMILKESIHIVASKHGMEVTMAPKTSSAAAGAGMHMHFGITDDNGKSILGSSSRRYGLSKIGEQALAGVVHHLCSLLAVTTPSTNSFKRIGPGCWTGAFKCWGIENKEAPVRLCSGSPRQYLDGNGDVEHFELKLVDSTCNPYLALVVIIAAALDGLDNEDIQLTEPLVGDPRLREESEDWEGTLHGLPKTLDAALIELDRDQVLKDAMGARLYRAYTAVKRHDYEQMKGLNLDQDVALLASKGI